IRKADLFPRARPMPASAIETTPPAHSRGGIQLERSIDSSIPDVSRVKSVAEALITNISKVLVGKEKAIEEALCTLLCHGHILAEDVPGVGKTILARALARSLGVSFRRIRVTPDWLPSDVIGVTVFDPVSRTFEFRRGPIFAQVALAAEINRGTPRTQSALLECMEARQVTVDGEI